jgi:hypothetical protein
LTGEWPEAPSLPKVHPTHWEPGCSPSGFGRPPARADDRCHRISAICWPNHQSVVSYFRPLVEPFPTPSATLSTQWIWDGQSYI